MCALLDSCNVKQGRNTHLGALLSDITSLKGARLLVYDGQISGARKTMSLHDLEFDWSVYITPNTLVSYLIEVGERLLFKINFGDE